MADEKTNDPAKKLRSLLTGGKPSAVANLPKKDASGVSDLPRQDASGIPNLPPKGDKKNPPVGTKETPKAVVTPALPKKKNSLPSWPKTASASNDKKLSFGPPFWTIASIISLTFNVIVLIALLGLLFGLNNSGFKVSSMVNLGSSFLGGLYTNFEKMDRASITTDVQVQTTIPVKFDLQLNQQTSVVLSQDVTINNALVTVNTGGLNITRANTTIVLPQGTTLPIVLNLTVPVNTTVPVTLNVPVNIPLSQTQLHVPFAGLQDVIGPYYCMLAPSALNLDQQPLCPYKSKP